MEIWYNDKFIETILSFFIGICYIALGVFLLGLKWNGNIFEPNANLLYLLFVMFTLVGLSIIMTDILKYADDMIVRITRFIFSIFNLILTIVAYIYCLTNMSYLVKFFGMVYVDKGQGKIGFFILVFLMLCSIIKQFVDCSKMKRGFLDGKGSKVKINN